MAWWLLGTPNPPATVVVNANRNDVTQRAGLIAAAGERQVAVRLAADEAGRLTGLDEEDPIDWRDYLEPAPAHDCVVFGNLASSENRPPDPDEHGRRYQWMRGLVGAQKTLPPKLRDIAVSDGTRCLYELVDNVHRWAQADTGVGTVFVTRGGGQSSFDRLHIVVMDAGRGIISSVLDSATAAPILNTSLAEDPSGLLLHFMQKAFGERHIPRHNGHGLHVSQLLAKAWAGRVDVLASDHRTPGLIHHARRTVANGVEGCESFELPGVTGTLASITLNLTPVTEEVRAKLRGEEEEHLGQLV